MRMNGKAALCLGVCAVSLLLTGCSGQIRHATNISTTTATLNGVGASACGGSGEIYFEYSSSIAALEAGAGTKTKSNYYGETAGACGENPPMYPYSMNIGGLAPGKTYYARFCGTENGGAAMCTGATQFTTRMADFNMQRLTISGDKFMQGDKPWVPFGYHYHSPTWEKYFEDPATGDWPTIAKEVRQARENGANSIRIYLQLFDFVERDSAGVLRIKLDQNRAYRRMLGLAQREQLYLNVSGDLVWKPGRVPAWYDQMTNEQRWEVQAFFWKSIAAASANSPAVMSYELTSEPGMSSDPAAAWYTGILGDYYFVQIMARGLPVDGGGVAARQWVTQMRQAINKHDPTRPVTIGLLPFWGGAFGVQEVGGVIDAMAVHQYPNGDDATAEIQMLSAWKQTGKPVFIGESAQYEGSAKTRADLSQWAAANGVGIHSWYTGVQPDNMTPTNWADAFYQFSMREARAQRALYFPNDG